MSGTGRTPARVVFAVVQRIEEVILAGGILLIAALTIANVILRTTTGNSIVYAEELSQFAMIFVTFVGASYAASKGRHIRMTAIYDNLSPGKQKVIMLVITAFTSLLMFALAWFAIEYALTVRALGTVSPALQVPLWIVYLAAPVGLFLGGVQYGLAFVKNLRTDAVYLSFDHKDEYDEQYIEGALQLVAVFGLFLLGVMLVLLFAGFPMKVPLITATLLGLIFFYPGVSPSVVIQQMIGGIKPAALIAVPMFIFAADIMTRGQAADRLLDLIQTFVAHRRGGLPITTAITCTLFGALSGSTQATVVAIGGPIRPKMLQAGYPDSFTTALIINASDIALLIPPSIGVIVYGVVSGVSIGELFIAGIGPGLLILVLFCGYCYIASIRMGVAPRPRATWAERRRAMRRALLPLGFPVIIIGGIYAGFFSPTEAAAMSVLYAALLEVGIYREMSLADLWRTALSTGIVTAVVFVLVGAGAAFSWLISFAQLPDALINDFLGLTADSGYWTIMLTIAAAYFIGCMFVDPIVVILILTPIFHPVAAAAGIDGVLVGVLVTLQVAIGSATPPFGCDIFTAMAIFRRPYLDTIRGTPPFIFMLVGASIMLIAFPDIALFLRDLAFN